MKKKLTALAIPSLPEDEYWDTLQSGLILRVGTRRKTWVYRFEAGGVRKRERLGYFPDLGLADARAAAADLAKRIDAGLPVVIKQHVHPRSPEALTLGKLLNHYEDHRLREGYRIKSLPEAMRALRRGLADYVGMPVREFSDDDLRRVRDAIGKTAPKMANRFQAYLGPVLKWAAREKLIPRDFIGDVARTRETPRKRILDHNEIRVVWQACDALDANNRASKSYVRLIKFLLLTGARLDEAASMKYGYILDGVWKLPRNAESNKGDRENRLRLSRQALELVGRGEATAYVFPGRVHGKKISGWSRLKDTLDAAVQIPHWTHHDLRRTCVSGMQDLGIDRLTIELIQNHSLGGLAGVYLQGERMAEKAMALQKWGDLLENITRGVDQHFL